MVTPTNFSFPTLYYSNGNETIPLTFTNVTIDALKSTGNPHILIACTELSKKCLYSFATYASYEIPKTALQVSADLAYWLGKSIINISAPLPRRLATAIPSLSTPIEQISQILSEKREQLYAFTANQTEVFSSKLSTWAVKKSNQTLLEETTQHGINNPHLIKSFKGVDLIGPTLFLSYCTKHFNRNLYKSLSSLALLVSGKHRVSKVYQIKEISVEVANTQNHGVVRLIRDTIMHAGFAAIAGVIGTCTYHGIYNAIEEASGDSAHATTRARTILAVSSIIPFIPTALNWCKKLVKQTPGSKGSPPNASKFFYTTPYQDVKKPLFGKYPDISSGMKAILTDTATY